MEKDEQFEGKEEDGMDVDMNEADDGGDEIEDATAKPGKKKRVQKYHRIHAHRNPLNDGIYE